jgi:hypothetical protein
MSEPALRIPGSLNSAQGFFEKYSHIRFAAAGASLSRGSLILSVADCILRMTCRIDGPHLRTRERVPDESCPHSFLQRRLVSREIQQMRTKPTYTIAAISGTVGRSEMTQWPFVCFIHSFHL